MAGARSGLSSRELAVDGAVKHYRECLIGRDPMRIGALWQEMYRSQYFEGGRVLTAAIAAIDIALYDIAGKALGVPVYQLLGGKQRDFVPCFATAAVGIGPAVARGRAACCWTMAGTSSALAIGHPPDDDRSLFEPRESIGITAEWLTRVREEFGPDPVLGIDYHHRLTVAEAASFCQRMPSGTLDFLEEPIRDESPEAYAALRQMTDVPLAIGEEFSSKWAVPALHRARAHQLCAHRRVQRGRPDRGDEGGRLVRGALYRPDAAQPAGADLHRRHRAPGRGRAQLFLARGARLAHGESGLLRYRALPRAASAGGLALCGARRAGPGRGVQRGAGPHQGLRLQRDAAPASPRRLAHQLVRGLS